MYIGTGKMPKFNRSNKKLRNKNKQGDYFPSKKWSVLRKGASLRGFRVDITREQYLLLVDKGCQYCGANLWKEGGGSLDRVDNDLGYTQSNVLSCCGFCNKLRGSLLTVGETLAVIKALKEYRQRNNLPVELATPKSKLVEALCAKNY